jgi:aminoglycoside 6'-N-acetyltransferase
MLAEWLREPQVARWWNLETTLEAVERDFGASTRGEEPGEDLLVLLDGRPIGLLQRSAIYDYPQDLTEFSAVIEVPAGTNRTIVGGQPPITQAANVLGTVHGSASRVNNEA